VTDVVLFHHAHGLTDGTHAFADRLRAAGHSVTVPDLYDGAVFASLDDGVAHAESIGFDTIIARGVAAAVGLPAAVVCAGFSLGTLPTQKLAQTRPGVLGAVIYHGGEPPSAFGTAWPDRVALQVHVVEHDPWADLAVARELVAEAAEVAPAELFVYPGSAHLVADESLPDYDPVLAGQILTRSLAFLARW
jgi:dienelactone hydrolase